MSARGGQLKELTRRIAAEEKSRLNSLVLPTIKVKPSGKMKRGKRRIAAGYGQVTWEMPKWRSRVQNTTTPPTEIRSCYYLVYSPAHGSSWGGGTAQGNLHAAELPMMGVVQAER